MQSLLHAKQHQAISVVFFFILKFVKVFHQVAQVGHELVPFIPKSSEQTGIWIDLHHKD